MKIQDFNYHCHSSFSDGRNSVEEMIRKYEELGFKELGISDHICCHPNMPNYHSMFLTDYNKALDIYKRGAEAIRVAGEKSKMKVSVGFEVDFFPSTQWRNAFEEMIKSLDYDYLIGSVHHLFDAKEECIYVNQTVKNIPQANFDEYVELHWKNIVAAVKSGYFSFMAHLDGLRRIGSGSESKWVDHKIKIIEALAESKLVCELNTSGHYYSSVGEQHPQRWMLEELNKRNVPIIINDDAHDINQAGRGFEAAEKLLSELNYTNRWKPII